MGPKVRNCQAKILSSGHCDPRHLTLGIGLCIYLAVTLPYYCISFTLSPTCKALDTNMSKKKRESHDLHR
jgi:hypothetical protein